jgi:predicted RNase H-like HicB family nuclease
MTYMFPAVLHRNDDGSFTITYPDLPGCVSEGKSLENAWYMAQSALTQWLQYLGEKGQEIPRASSVNSIERGKNELVNLFCVDTKNDRAVRRTVSIPQWMAERVEESHLSLSRVLQEALAEKFA